jgi:exodeoxyribonuclease V beta subunit
MRPFVVESVEIKESNLIEASAGTGKTYSIAILTLRLIVEKNIPIGEILMVTFTNAAVAELESRIREFVGKAYRSSVGILSGDTIIDNIVNNSKDTIGEVETSLRLKNALLFLDETSIMTMHGFCQKTLSEFAFETQQVFGAETLSKDAVNVYIIDGLNAFWRKHITTLDISLLKYLTEIGFNQKMLFDIVDQALAGKKLVPLAEIQTDFLTYESQMEILARLNISINDISTKTEALNDFIDANREDLRVKVGKNRYAVDAYLPLMDNNTALIGAIIKSNDKKKGYPNYVKQIFGEVITFIEACAEKEEFFNKQVKIFANQIFQMAIKIIIDQFETMKEKSSFLTFNDMIIKVHHAVYLQKHPLLLEALRRKYKAAFIDEFQDTDRLQYEIFHTLFSEKNILFYIGDPKQSIYGWRKADIFTYFEARKSVLHQYEMNTNFRSSTAVIHALNAFFYPIDDFDTFYYKNIPNNPDSIQYKNVNAPGADKGFLTKNGTQILPLTILACKNNGTIATSVASIIVEMLSDAQCMITENGVSRRIKPSDFGILIRSKAQGMMIKSSLDSFKIPSVTIDDSKILETSEAQELLYVLKAVLDIEAGNINKALLSSLTGFTINEILALDEEQVLNQFKLYQQDWEKKGVYVMLMRFFSDFKVKMVLLGENASNGERRLSNVLQLAELLHKISTRKQFMPSDLTDWLHKGIEGKINEGDEYEQRVENDEDAVKIITIHKSKGLEYNIVMAPFLDLMSDPSHTIESYRKDDGTYWFIDGEHLTAEQSEWVKTQNEQENRRLLYVALTRTKYKCYIHSSLHSRFKTSALKAFITEPKKLDATLIEYVSIDEVEPVENLYSSEKDDIDPNYAIAEKFALLHPNWMKLSYTSLTPEHTIQPKIDTIYDGDVYSQFVFKQLKRGAHTGNLLHYIFEHVDFSNTEQWEKIILKALKRLSGVKDDTYIGQLKQLINEVVLSKIQLGEDTFSLQNLKRDKRLDEFEFDMRVPVLDTNKIQELSTNESPFMVKTYHQIEGMLNGRIDLFFETGGRYYILDWKSNSLGNAIAAYNMENIKVAMAENNYNLQLHVYTVAVCKYLTLRKPDFDYEKDFGGVIYLFVRGIRAEGKEGIFFFKPVYETIQKLTRLLTV